MKVETGRLPNGARVAVLPMPEAESVTIGIWLAVGGRYEPARLQGVSHFIEHLLFKGTRRRNARRISEEIEGVGGYLNAFTAEEMTCYHARVPAPRLGLAIDVLADMLTQSVFAPEEVERERGVICEEIRMYEDQPAQLVLEELSKLMFPGHPLGRPLTGTVEGLQRMKRSDVLAYYRRHYHPRRAWVVAAGKTDLGEVTRLAGEHLRRWRPGTPGRWAPVPATTRARRLQVVSKPIEQAQLAVGWRGVSGKDPRRAAVRLANVILGENMSSRLFQVIRERHGLAYSIDSSVSYLGDTGRWVVSAGVEPAKLARALRLVMKTLRQLGAAGPTKWELARAREYFLGQTALGLESSEQRMMWAGESLIHFGKVRPLAEIVREAIAVTPADVRAAAAELLRPDRASLAIVAPEAQQAEEWEACLR